ncbi:hypothetical protein EVAR_94373_1 [Eumeta japonica]|uniref:Uncharacterized protein n=1 Tax=Eumeta variegata TaxID=151549 RepID=A0A4C1TPX0_EUMVA|nr:hypothetical protein EVAR_94373_1 [Eumeta japonica]
MTRRRRQINDEEIMGTAPPTISATPALYLNILLMTGEKTLAETNSGLRERVDGGENGLTSSRISVPAFINQVCTTENLRGPPLTPQFEAVMKENGWKQKQSQITLTLG